MQAIDNTNLLQICNDCGAIGFTPALAYEYDPEAATVTVTNSSTIPAGDTFKKVRLYLNDDFGHEVRGTITVAATPNVLSTVGLDLSKPLFLRATILTTGMIAADGSAFPVMAAGTVGRWDVQKNA